MCKGSKEHEWPNPSVVTLYYITGKHFYTIWNSSFVPLDVQNYFRSYLTTSDHVFGSHLEAIKLCESAELTIIILATLDSNSWKKTPSLCLYIFVILIPETKIMTVLGLILESHSIFIKRTGRGETTPNKKHCSFLCRIQLTSQTYAKNSLL